MSIRLILTALILPLILGACSPVFVIKGAYQQAKILYRSEPIEQILQDNSDRFTQEEMLKLQLVPLVREYCAQIGLDTKGTFTTYSKLDSNELVWVISASPLDSFEPYKWWFPIVGSVPYKGYFSREEAFESAEELKKMGYETWVRPSAAFSTLGWFNDPLLSSTLNLGAEDLVNTIIHETVHVNVWIPGSVAFNESLANFVGSRAAIDFFRLYKSRLPEKLQQLDIKAELDFKTELLYSKATEDLWNRLKDLYASELSVADKLIERQKIFNNHKKAFEISNPSRRFLSSLNNAELAQRRLYLKSLNEFEQVFKLRASENWPAFFEILKEFALSADKRTEEQNFQEFFAPQLDKEAPAS